MRTQCFLDPTVSAKTAHQAAVKSMVMSISWTFLSSLSSGVVTFLLCLHPVCYTVVFFPLPSFKDWPSLSSRSGSYSPHSWKVQVYFLHLLLSYLDCDQFPQLLCASCFVLYCNRNETISVLPELLVVVISLF